MTKLERLLKEKTDVITAQQGFLERKITELGAQFAEDVARIVGAGVFDLASFVSALDAIGYTDTVIEGMRDIEQLLAYSKRISEAMGVSFILTPANEVELAEFITVAVEGLRETFGNQIARDMQKFAMASRFSDQPFEQIVNAAKQRLAPVGRSAGTEVATALATFDRTAQKRSYENAGIDLFWYYPPSVIETSRDTCIAAVSSQFQQTGWTMQDIQNFPGIDFVQGGEPFYNCMHQFLPFKAKALYESFSNL